MTPHAIALLLVFASVPSIAQAQAARMSAAVKAEGVVVEETGQRLTVFGNYMVYKTTPEDQTIVESISAKGSPGTRLAFGCTDENLLFALLTPGTSLIGDDAGEIFVSWRTGAAALKEDFWKLQSDEQRSGRSVGQAKELAEALGSGKEVAMTASETNGERIINATFSARGFKEAAAILARCRKP